LLALLPSALLLRERLFTLCAVRVFGSLLGLAAVDDSFVQRAFLFFFLAPSFSLSGELVNFGVRAGYEVSLGGPPCPPPFAGIHTAGKASCLSTRRLLASTFRTSPPLFFFCFWGGGCCGASYVFGGLWPGTGSCFWKRRALTFPALSTRGTFPFPTTEGPLDGGVCRGLPSAARSFLTNPEQYQRTTSDCVGVAPPGSAHEGVSEDIGYS